MAKTAIVTASDSGIGKATAVHLARDGFDVGITWHSDRDGAEGTAREVQEHERPALPEGRPGNAHEIAAAIAFLASPDARYANGASFVIDGGLSLTAAQFNQEAAGS